MAAIARRAMQERAGEPAPREGGRTRYSVVVRAVLETWVTRATVVRIVVNGCPWEEEGGTNFDKAREMLNQALKSDGWPTEQCIFVITPGGFIQARMPANYGGKRGWNSRPQDFQDLIPTAQRALDRVLTTKLLQEFGLCAKFLTLGVDLMQPGESKGTAAPRRRAGGPHRDGTHAELVAVVDLSTGRPCRWTGKSYPLGWQENKLVHEADLQSHCWLSEPRTLILGCHDLTAWNGRARANAKHPPRVERWKELDKLAVKLEPELVLHHPHQTDYHTWAAGWRGVREHLDSVQTYASGIAYYNQYWLAGGEPREPFSSVLQGTKWGAVADVLVDGYRLA